ncbi:Store-operated calcium entry regulator STIMATE [Hondaea fermentalgiana]|uniref:Store-operated calcium entry regulator STIMATE n=1 Tax=Hondaea fermentalgiana TaxID=2315210 RepID=A0A2R5GTU0_9STRA|nr:Store-operated calcium entry regulator STIMATE [Hondaea fermentalgiana]|eukprot:GBG34286.1 Store-operated calcium entry regulator STIMATE [Hondaea fermentalgiana]
MAGSAGQQCALLGGSFAIFVQFFLLCVVLCTLYLKWILEEPRRPRHIWTFDSLKQCIGAGTGHCMNIVMALILSSSSASGNECAWYFMNFTVDTVLGVPLNFVLLKLLERTLLRNSAKTGAYYDLHTKRIDFCAWTSQTVAWTSIVVVCKTILAIPMIKFNHELSDAADRAFKPLEAYPKTQLVFVMIVWPAICNSFQFYVIDNFLKRNIHRSGSSLLSSVHGSAIVAAAASSSSSLTVDSTSDNLVSNEGHDGQENGPNANYDDADLEDSERFNGGWISLLQNLFRTKPKKPAQQNGEQAPLLPA